MEKRCVGKSDLRLSVVGLGTNGFGAAIPDDMAQAIINAALDLGVTFIETADIYGNRGGSESVLGKYLGVHRKDIVLATKFGMPMDQKGELGGASRRYIMMAVEASLQRLRTDWIDLYQLHTPDPITPMEETLRALDDLIAQGKIRYIGHSNFSAWQIADAAWQARHLRLTGFISSQLEYSLLNRDIERDALPAMTNYEIGLLPYLPLAAGMLTGRYRRGDPLPARSRLSSPGRATRYRSQTVWPMVEALSEFCRARGHTLLELAFNWLLARPNVCCVMAGASSPEQLKNNVASIGWALTSEDLETIDQITAQTGT